MNDEGIEELIESLTARLEKKRSEALRLASSLARSRDGNRRPLSVHQFHARIGRWNTTFVDSIREQFYVPNDFLGGWIDGLISAVEALDAKTPPNDPNRGSTSEHEVLRFLQEPLLYEYIVAFLERNFYRNYLERTRSKPSDSLWQIWFGRGNMTWGLLIAPAFRRNGWTNDVSEIRRAKYHYWTVGHLLSTGLIDPSSQTPIRFSTVTDLLAFYASVLKRDANSPYEQGIADRYVAYVKGSTEPESEPLLVPELRYGGKAVQHLYRLDFTVLNSHTMEKTGFELSPSSTHLAVTGTVKGKKTQKQINEELKESWEKEMEKRNAYFREFGISIVTFTDTALKDLDGCFAQIATKLRSRSRAVPSLNESMRRLKALHLRPSAKSPTQATAGSAPARAPSRVPPATPKKTPFESVLEHPVFQARVRRKIEDMLQGKSRTVETSEGPLEGSISNLRIGEVNFRDLEGDESKTGSFSAYADVTYDALSSEGEDLTSEQDGVVSGAISLSNVHRKDADDLAESIEFELRIEDWP